MNPETGIKNADEALKEQEEVAVLTAGTSMQPMLREHRDIAIIERVNRKLRANDVPLYRKSGYDKLVLHRILKVTKNGYVIRGDNLFTKEYDVTDDDIVGVLKAFYRDGKYYDCQKSKAYRLYVFFIRAAYPAKFLWRRKIRPFPGRIKRVILGRRH